MGSHIGEPLSRLRVRSSQIVLLNVGPENSAPSVRATRLLRARNGASPPNDPRLSPNTTSFARLPSGRSLTIASTASNSACPAWRAFSLSTRTDSQLGRNEYCMLTVAVLPLYMYSNAEASASLIQQVPVVVATATTARCSPPVRSNSRAARSAVASMSFAEPSPAYARIGWTGGAPLEEESSFID